MADDQNLGELQQHYYAPNPARIIQEYDLFAGADKYKQTHILPLPQNPEVLRGFSVPELVPPWVFRGQKKTAKVRDPKLIDKGATSIRIFGVDINVDQQIATKSINKAGKEKMMQPSSNDDEDKSTRLMGNTKGIIINEEKNTTTNLGNPRVDHQEIRDFLKLQVGRSNLGLDDDQETAVRSINKGKEKILMYMGESSINQKLEMDRRKGKGILFGDEKTEKGKMVETEAHNYHGFNSSPPSSHSNKGIIIKEAEKMEKKRKTSKRKSENCNLEDHNEKAPPLFHPSILREIQDGHDPPVFLFEKELTMSDIKGNQNRLLISDADKLLQFLGEEEKRKVKDKQDNLVIVTKEAVLANNQHTLHLTTWNKSTIFLKHEWRKFVDDNKLQCGDSVQGWGYRVGHELRLALNIIIKPVNNSQVS